MGDDRGHIHASIEEVHHLVPSIEDFPTIDAFKKEAFEDDFLPVADGGFG